MAFWGVICELWVCTLRGVIAPNKDGFQIIQMCDTVPGHKFSLGSVWFCLQGR